MNALNQVSVRNLADVLIPWAASNASAQEVSNSITPDDFVQIIMSAPTMPTASMVVR